MKKADNSTKQEKQIQVTLSLKCGKRIIKT